MTFRSFVFSMMLAAGVAASAFSASALPLAPLSAPGIDVEQVHAVRVCRHGRCWWKHHEHWRHYNRHWRHHRHHGRHHSHW